MTSNTLIFGSAGIGGALVHHLTAQGDRVHVVARDRQRLQLLADDTGASTSAADATIDGDIERAVAEAHEHLGGIDALCYAAGTITLKSVSRLTDDDITRDFRVNAHGALTAVRAALPALKASQGTASVLLFSTVAVAQGFALHASVAMAKGAVEGLTRALAAELAPKVRVNCIAPSLTRTPLAASLLLDPARELALGQLHAMGRIGEGADMVALAALLLSPAAGFVTGQVIGVDGGRSTLRTKG